MVVLAAAISFHVAPSLANKDSGAVVVADDGTIEMPSFSIPLSEYMSEEAKAKFLDARKHGMRVPAIDKDAPDSVLKARSAYDQLVRPTLARAQQRYPVKIESRDIGGVRAHVIEPEAGVARENKTRVLINLHGGGFVMGDGLGIVESIPIAVSAN